MSVALTGRAPFRQVLGYEKMLDEHGREMHGSWGNMIDAEDAFARMGADVMRWQYCAQPPEPEPPLRLRAGARDQAEAADALELRASSSSTTRTSRASSRATPISRRARAASCSRSTAGSSRARAQLVAEATAGYERWLTVDVDRAPSRRSSTTSRTGTSAARGGGSGTATRPRSARSGTRSSRGCACRAGDAVPRRAPLAGPRRATSCEGAPRSVFLAGWPEARRRPTPRCSPRSRELRRVVELGHQARSAVGPEAPAAAAALVVEGAPLAARARGRDRRGAARQGGRVRPRRAPSCA